MADESLETTTFNARLTKRVKGAIQRAADLRGQSLSDFVLGTAYDRAMETISAENLLMLTDTDSKRFSEALAAPADIDEAILQRFFDADEKSAR